jgi:hypothetical protein
MTQIPQKKAWNKNCLFYKYGYGKNKTVGANRYKQTKRRL